MRYAGGWCEVCLSRSKICWPAVKTLSGCPFSWARKTTTATDSSSAVKPSGALNGIGWRSLHLIVEVVSTLVAFVILDQIEKFIFAMIVWRQGTIYRYFKLTCDHLYFPCHSKWVTKHIFNYQQIVGYHSHWYYKRNWSGRPGTVEQIASICYGQFERASSVSKCAYLSIDACIVCTITTTSCYKWTVGSPEFALCKFKSAGQLCCVDGRSFYVSRDWWQTIICKLWPMSLPVVD